MVTRMVTRILQDLNPINILLHFFLMIQSKSNKEPNRAKDQNVPVYLIENKNLPEFAGSYLI